MGVFKKAAAQRFARRFGFAQSLVYGVLFSFAMSAAAGTTAQIEIALQPAETEPLVVRNDHGGLVGKRAKEVQALRKTGRAVELRGRVCLSSCTMYIGLDRACVSASTTFGFHGPSYYGRPLSPRDFEYWSQLIAEHYPPALKAWYLREGRYRKTGYYRIKGSALIAMGLRRCS